MRLIDADALKESIKQQCDFCSSMGIKELSEIFRKALFQEIDNAKTIEERKKGKWIRITDGLYEYSQCDQCGHKEYYESNYCADCGAVMRGTPS